ncbi:MAG: glycosyl hydrolase [Oceanospirillales bacterium]|nr:glycosyl hydrolase [Oceanospirillales bacterium]
MNAPTNPSRRNFFRQMASRFDPNAPAVAPWSLVPEVNAGDGDVLWSGWTGQGQVFVVGDEGRVLHFDSHPETQRLGWQLMDVPIRQPLHGIWGRSPNDLHAVGWMGCILHFDGEQWQSVQGGVVDNDQGRFTACTENTPLFAIDGNAAGEAWAVGDNGCVLHFDGAHWQPETSGITTNLRAVTCTPGGHVYAAGNDGSVIRRDEHGQWQVLDCPHSSGLHALLVLGEDELLLAGGRYFVDQGGFRGELLRYADGCFTPLTFDTPLPRLRALRAYKDGVLIVGDQGRLFYLKDNQLKQLECNTHHDLMDIIPLASGEALVVGDFGTVMTAAPEFVHALAPAATDETTSHWQIMPSATERQLWGITQTHDGTCYACGDAGTVLRLHHDVWEPLPAPSELPVHCLWSCPGSGLFAAGQEGRIFRFDGQHWQLHFDLHLDLTILALWGTAPDSIYAVGDEGLILHFDGLRWQRMPSGTTSALYSLWGLDDAHLLAVGDFGLVMRYNGDNWKDFNAGTEQFIYGIWGAALDDIHAVGLSGTLTHFDGQRWHAVPARVQDDLLAISGSASGVFAVGTRGCALHLEHGSWQRETTPSSEGLRAVCATAEGTVYAVGDRGVILRRRAP